LAELKGPPAFLLSGNDFQRGMKMEMTDAEIEAVAGGAKETEASTGVKG
jgi:hypothetical protein